MRSTGNHFSVHGEFNFSVVADDVIMIPFAGRFGSALARQAALPARRMWSIRCEVRAVNRENVAIARVIFGVMTIQNLHLNRARERLSLRRYRIAPDKQSRVPTRNDVFPIQLDFKILVLLFSAHHPCRFAGAHDNSVANCEGIWCNIDWHPASQIAAIKERLPFGRKTSAAEKKSTKRKGARIHSSIIVKSDSRRNTNTGPRADASKIRRLMN